jgi:hypothetical protein
MSAMRHDTGHDIRRRRGVPPVGLVRRRGTLAIGAALLALASGTAVEADRGPAAPVNEAWRTECGACHVPYPPRLLPGRSWSELVSGLERHFGTDASLEPAVVAEILAFLERHAGRDRGGPPALRMTETAWFRREHREVPAAAWGRPAVKSPANCGACHPAAERGRYDEDTVAVPR